MLQLFQALHLVCTAGRSTKECSWIGLLSGDGILFPEFSVLLKRRRQNSRNKPAWMHRGIDLPQSQQFPGDGWPWRPGSAGMLVPLAPAPLPETLCVCCERSKPSTWTAACHQTHFLWEASVNSRCERTQLPQRAVTGFSSLTLLSVPALVQLIHNTRKPYTAAQFSLRLTEQWVSCRWPRDILQPVLSKWQKAARQCC